MVKTDFYIDPENETICIRSVDETGAVIPTLPQIRLNLSDLQYADQVGSDPIQMICRRVHFTTPAGAKKRCYGLLTIPEDDTTDDGHSSATEDLYLGGGSGGGPQRMRVLSLSGDYLVCNTWDGTTLGATNINVAKPPQLRHSLIYENVEGASLTYTYASRSNNLDGQRSVTDGTTTQIEIILPVYQNSATTSGLDYEIWADQPIGGTGVAAAPVWMDTNRDGRIWVQIE